MDATAQLFDRIPETLLRTLGGTQPRFHWALLHHIYTGFFAPEAPVPQGDGWLHRHLSASVEEFLRRWDQTNPPDVRTGDPTTPPGMRAATYLAQYKDHGWLAEERVGYARYVVMRPTVQSLFELLKGFAEAGPEFIGGRIQVIRSMVHETHRSPATSAAGFHTAARECSALLRMLNTLRLRIKEASEWIRKEQEASAFVQGFFEEYIGRLYVGDYREMFARNHPLHHRWEIVELTDDLRDDPEKYSQLLAWYTANMRVANPADARLRLDEDFDRFAALSQVDELLERLKLTVSRANDEALGYLRYRMRTPGAVEAHIERTIDAINRTAQSREGGPAPFFTLGWSGGLLFSEHNIRLRDSAPRKRLGSPIVPRVVSPEVRARRWIRKLMRDNRTVSPQQIGDYLDALLAERNLVTTHDLRIQSIKDLCIFAALTRLAMIATRLERGDGARRWARSRHPFAPLLERYRVRMTGSRYVGTYFDTPEFHISLNTSEASRAR